MTFPNKISPLDRHIKNGICLLLLPAPFIFLPSVFDFSVLPKKAFILCGVCLILINPYEGISTLIHTVACAIVFFSVSGLSRNGQASAIVTTLATAAIGIATLGLMQRLSLIDVIPQTSPPAATFANRNLAAIYISMVMPLFLTFLLCKTRFSSCLFGFIGLAICIGYLSVSETRSGWLAGFVEFLIIAGCIIYSSERKNRNRFMKSILVFILAASVILAIIWRFLPNPIFQNVSVMKDAFRHDVTVLHGKNRVNYPDSFFVRLVVWKNSPAIAKEGSMIKMPKTTNCMIFFIVASSLPFRSLIENMQMNAVDLKLH